ncbi:MAG: hypothetical protein Q4F95_02240 [Oscillospiraceae bacterium]|nr:hypothetical protein [Oscillospiraceae bacterium]
MKLYNRNDTKRIKKNDKAFLKTFSKDVIKSLEKVRLVAMATAIRVLSSVILEIANDTSKSLEDRIEEIKSYCKVQCQVKDNVEETIDEAEKKL